MCLCQHAETFCTGNKTGDVNVITILMLYQPLRNKRNKIALQRWEAFEDLDSKLITILRLYQ